MATERELLQRAHSGNPDLIAAFLVDAAGSVSASAGDDTLLAATTAFLVPIRDMLDRSVAELGCGEFASALIEGRDGALAVADVDGERMVAVIGERHAAAGALCADARWLAQALLSREAA